MRSGMLSFIHQHFVHSEKIQRLALQMCGASFSGFALFNSPLASM